MVAIRLTCIPVSIAMLLLDTVVVARQFLANAARKESTTAMPPGYKHRTATIAPSPSEGLFYTSLSAANPRRGGTSGEFFDFASTPPDQSASSSNKTGEMIDYHSWVNPQRREGGVGAEVASRGAGLHWLNPMSQSGGRSSGGDEDGIHRRMGPDSLLGAPIIDVTTSERWVYLKSKGCYNNVTTRKTRHSTR